MKELDENYRHSSIIEDGEEDHVVLLFLLYLFILLF